jgi:hypothetical protein
MNIKYIISAALFATLPSLMLAQTGPDATTVERNNQPPTSITSGNSQDNKVEASDAGAQRPIFLKTEKISGFAGLDSRYFYRDNPFQASDKFNDAETAIWTNTAYVGANFEAIEIDDAVITPYIGASYTKTEYLESGLDGFNFNSTSAYAMLTAQHSNGWTYRAGVSYAMDSSEVSNEETYSEFYPYIGAMKTHSVYESIVGIFDITAGKHFSKSDDFFSTSDSPLDNFDATISYGLQYVYQNFIISPRYALTYKTFSDGSNDGREDLIHLLSLKVDYPINENLNVGVFGSFNNKEKKKL